MSDFDCAKDDARLNTDDSRWHTWPSCRRPRPRGIHVVLESINSHYTESTFVPRALSPPRRFLRSDSDSSAGSWCAAVASLRSEENAPRSCDETEPVSIKQVDQLLDELCAALTRARNDSGEIDTCELRPCLKVMAQLMGHIVALVGGPEHVLASSGCESLRNPRKIGRAHV